MLNVVLNYAPLIEPVGLLLVPGIIAWLAWRLKAMAEERSRPG